MTKFSNAQTASQRVFATYTRSISELFLDKYGASYATQENTRNTWRASAEYSRDAEEFLILQSRIFIRMLDSRDPNSTNPQFLKSLTNLMADYLSAYTKKNPIYHSRNEAKAALKELLFTKFGYINRLQNAQTAARRASQVRNNAINQARAAHNSIKK